MSVMLVDASAASLCIAGSACVTRTSVCAEVVLSCAVPNSVAIVASWVCASVDWELVNSISWELLAEGFGAACVARAFLPVRKRALKSNNR